jgi:hypothetical protein
VIWCLRLLFIGVLVSMLAVTSWAGSQCPLFALPRGVSTHPWFIATLCDAYWGFVTFLVWVGYKQTTRSAQFAWIVAVLLLGNIAMAAYCLSELFLLPASGRLADLWTVRRDGPGALGLGLAGVGLALVLIALR